MPFHLILGQGQGYGGLKCVKMANSNSISSANMHVKRLMLSYDNPKDNISILTRHIFDIHPRLVSHDLQT